MLRILRTHFLTFLFIIILTLITGYIQMKPAWDMGFSRDGWNIFVEAKLFSTSPKDVITKCWEIFGPHSASRCVYFALVDYFFKDNYSWYIRLDFIFKILGSLMLYPLIFVLFKNRLLAFLTSLIFAASHVSYGSLAETIDGAEYLSLFFLCFSLISYYYLLKNFSVLKVSITSILLFLMFIMSP